jgi:hypothetical protein
MVPAIELVQEVYDMYCDSVGSLTEWEETFIIDLHNKFEQKPSMILSARQEMVLEEIKEKLENLVDEL